MKPTVTKVTPTSGTTLGGTTVTIAGANYTGYGKSLVQTVWFGGTWKGTNIHILSNGLLKVTSPRGAGTVKVRVATVAGLSNVTSASMYTFAAAPVSVAPVVSSVSPNTGSTLGGTSVTITGSNLLGATGVMFGTTPALFMTSSTDGHSITATAPAGTLGSVNVTVTTPAGTSAVSAADQFTYTAPVTNSITAFGFASPVVTGTIDQANHTIAVTVPWGTNVTALVASFTAPGATVSVGTTPQVSGTTANDFTNPVTYTVTAANGATQTYTVTVTVAASSAKAITAFSLMGVNGTINQSNDTIVVNLPYTPNVTALVATFTTTGATVSVGSTPQVSASTANDFTNPVTYTVTAGDGSTQSYVVTVNVAVNPGANAITAYSLPGETGAAIINQTAHTIAVSVPYGTNLNSVVASFTAPGATVKVGSTPQVSGVTPNNFLSSVTYTVTAANGATQTYTVTVTVASQTAKAITAFSFDGLTPAVAGTITAPSASGPGTIALTVPYGTNVTALVPTIQFSGSSMSPASGVAENFSNPVTYTVTDSQGSTQVYVVTVTVAAQPAQAITAFSFGVQPNLTTAVTGTINQTTHAITLTVPWGTNVTALVASFTAPGATVSVGTTSQISGVTANNFSNSVSSPVVYTVTPLTGGSTQNYFVTVTVAPSPTAKAITAFNFDGLSPVVDGVISGNTIALTVPYGTNVTALVPTIVFTGAAMSPASGVAENFSSPVNYTVTDATGSTQVYIVTVTVLPNPAAKAITAFTVPNEIGTTTINQTNHTIALTVPYGTNVTALVPTITFTGASVSPASGVAQSFTSGMPVTYTVTDSQGSTQDYAVTVTVAADSANAITAFSVPNEVGSAVITNATTSGTGTIAVTVPYGTNVSNLVATFTAPDATVAVSGVSQTSGTTVNNFTAPVTYTVTAANGTTQNYVVTVTPENQPTTIAVYAGNNQTAPVNTAVVTNPSVLVTDAHGNPVGGVSVTFAVASGSGTVTNASATTDANGIATVGSWTLGTTAGSNTLTATATGLTGSPVTFTATGTAAAASKLVLTTPPSSSATSGTPLAQQPVVTVEDQYGNTVTNSTVTVTVTTPTSGATLSGNTAVATGGVATFSGLTITDNAASSSAPVAVTLTFTSGTLTSVSAIVSVT
jgi:hypothetical protein